jgi:hypothetical protein
MEKIETEQVRSASALCLPSVVAQACYVLHATISLLRNVGWLLTQAHAGTYKMPISGLFGPRTRGVWSPPEQRGQGRGLGRKSQGAHSHAQLTYPSLVIQAIRITFALRAERSKCRAPWGCREGIHFKVLVVCPNPAYSDYPNQAEQAELRHQDRLPRLSTGQAESRPSSWASECYSDNRILAREKIRQLISRRNECDHSQHALWPSVSSHRRR